MFAKAWVLAARPKTWTASLVPVVVATLLALKAQGTVKWEISFYALCVALLIQVGTNLINDALDFKRGVDTAERIGPIRATQAGLLTLEQVFACGIACFLAALLLSFPLMIAGGWPIGMLLLISTLCGYVYTGGPAPLSYNGLGDLFVLIFFGFGAVGGLFYLQTGYLNADSFAAGAQVGLLSTVLIAVNNLRDVEGDRRANKMTLPVRFGVEFGRFEITALILLTYAIGLYWLFRGEWSAALLPVLTLPISLKILSGVWNEAPGKIYNQFLAWSALLHLCFGLCLIAGWMADG